MRIVRAPYRKSNSGKVPVRNKINQIEIICIGYNTVYTIRDRRRR